MASRRIQFGLSSSARRLMKSTGRSRINSSSCCIWICASNPQSASSLNVTNRSISLSGRKSLRSADPKRANSRIFQRRQKSASACWGRERAELVIPCALRDCRFQLPIDLNRLRLYHRPDNKRLARDSGTHGSHDTWHHRPDLTAAGDRNDGGNYSSKVSAVRCVHGPSPLRSQNSRYNCLNRLVMKQSYEILVIECLMNYHGHISHKSRNGIIQ